MSFTLTRCSGGNGSMTARPQIRSMEMQIRQQSRQVPGGLTGLLPNGECCILFLLSPMSMILPLRSESVVPVSIPATTLGCSSQSRFQDMEDKASDSISPWDWSDSTESKTIAESLHDTHREIHLISSKIHSTEPKVQSICSDSSTLAGCDPSQFVDASGEAEAKQTRSTDIESALKWCSVRLKSDHEPVYVSHKCRKWTRIRKHQKRPRIAQSEWDKRWMWSIESPHSTYYWLQKVRSMRGSS